MATAAALMEGELGRLLKVSAAVWAAMSYARLAAARLRPGAPRLAALLPVVALLCAAPFAFSTTTFRGTSGFFLAWLGSFKLLLLAAGRGPLADPSLSPSHFVFSASLPVKLRPHPVAGVKDGKLSQEAPAPARAAARLLLAGAALPAVIYAYQFKNAMSGYQLLVLYTLHVYLSLDLLLAGVHAAVHGVLGMELEPQVDRPYLASSLRDFWGRRWNLMVPSILRPAVYRPVRRRTGSPAAGVVAAFAVSGLMHELMFYYIMWSAPTGEVTAFFLLHGACTAAEGWWAAHGGWWRPPPPAAVSLTLAFVAGTGFWLFFPAMVRGGLDEMVLQECQGIVALMEHAGRRLAGASDLVSSAM
ncbi:hypothetical protein ACP4OV_028728 [Aristida adscensionis]